MRVVVAKIFWMNINRVGAHRADIRRGTILFCGVAITTIDTTDAAPISFSMVSKVRIC